MSRQRFLADNDLMDQIVLGVLRREPSIVITRLREVGLAKAPDTSVLEFAARERFIVVSFARCQHDARCGGRTPQRWSENGRSVAGASTLTAGPNDRRSDSNWNCQRRRRMGWRNPILAFVSERGTMKAAIDLFPAREKRLREATGVWHFRIQNFRIRSP